jgi:hypothetical protein
MGSNFSTSFQNKAEGSIFEVFAFFFLFEDAEGFARKIRVMYVLRIKNIAKLVTLKLIQGIKT